MKVNGQLVEASVELLSATPSNKPDGRIYQKDGLVRHIVAGAEKTLVTEGDVQTLTNKVLDKPEITNEQTVIPIAKPANPPAGKYKMYMKADGNYYRLDSNGVETLVNNSTSIDAILNTIDAKDAVIQKSLKGLSYISADLKTLGDTNFTTVDPSKNFEYYYGTKSFVFLRSGLDNELSVVGVSNVIFNKIITNIDDAAAIIGNHTAFGQIGTDFNFGVSMAPVNGGPLKFSFFGTGASLLICRVSEFTPDLFTVKIDGVSKNITPDKTSDPLRYTYPMISLPVASGLTAGYHEVEVNFPTAQSVTIVGYESFCDVPTRVQGTLNHAGKAYESATQTFNPSVDFPVGVNGGRVLAYHDMLTNTTKHKFQAVGSSAYGLSLVRESEELFKQYFPSSFAFSASTDLVNATATAAVRGGFSNDDLASIYGNMSGSNSSFYVTGANSIVFNFVGTGLDVLIYSIPGSNVQDYDVYINNATVAQTKITYNGGILQSICKNLPFGSHRVALKPGTTGSGSKNTPIQLMGFNVYAPKKPSLTADEVLLADFYVPAAFDSSGITSATAGYGCATGSIRNCSVESALFYDTGASPNFTTNLSTLTSGLLPVMWKSDKANHHILTSVTGTGFILRFEGATAGFSTLNITVNGQAFVSSSFPTATVTTYPTGLYTPGTGTFATGKSADGKNSSMIVTGLPFGTYHIKMFASSGLTKFVGVEAITPVVGGISNETYTNSFVTHFLQSGVQDCKPPVNRITKPIQAVRYSSGWNSGGASPSTTVTGLPYRMTNLQYFYSKGQFYRLKANINTNHSVTASPNWYVVASFGSPLGNGYNDMIGGFEIPIAANNKYHIFDKLVYVPKGWAKLDFYVYNNTAGTVTWAGFSDFELKAEV